ncbi:MAG: hypothetical protein EXQ47_10390 [Bryobacterales bacterium]|nr:hypothetical protein [Bryobacterales bacterium]
MRGLLIIVLSAAAIAQSQVSSGQAASNQGRGAVTGISKAEIDTVAGKNPKAVVSDQQLRVVGINGEYNLGVAIVTRTKGAGSQIAGSLDHSEVAEIYHIISGSATLVTGGAMENPKAAAPDSSVVKLTGPSTGGGAIRNGTSRSVGPGDVLIIPPNTPHWFSEITSDMVYLVFRVDPHKVLPIALEMKR